MAEVRMLKPVGVTDPDRLATLNSYDILDTPPEEGFDDIVLLATELCETPIALVTLVAGGRQWFKARVGFQSCETDLDRSICSYALAEPGLLIIPDLSSDPRTRLNPLVIGELGLRFYAGAPLRAANGLALGSLCVIDVIPRAGGLTDRQRTSLRALGRQVETMLELRRALIQRTEAERRLTENRQRLVSSEAYWRGLFERFEEGFIVGEVIRTADGRIVDWRYVDLNPAWSELVSIDRSTAVGRTIREVFPGIEDSWVDEFADVVRTGEPVSFTRQVGTLRRWYEGRAFRLDPERFGVIFVEITRRVEAENRREGLLELGDRLRNLGTVAELTQAAAALVGRVLGVARAGFGRLIENDRVLEVEPDWTRAGLPSIAGRHVFADYGDVRDDMLHGAPLIVQDVETDPRTAAVSAQFAPFSTRSLINMPVHEHGRVVGVFVVHDVVPRIWTDDEVGFLRSVADRVESAVRRRRAEDDQEILNLELSHRLKNTLALVQAIATQTLRNVAEKQAVAAFIDRLHAMSSAHDVLLRQSWLEAPIADVLDAVLATFGLADRFDISGPELMVGPRTTLSLSLLFHELATNAAKYGALSNETGRVSVAWLLEGAENDATLRLRWTETGGPPARVPTGRGFGSRLIQSGLVGTGGVSLHYEQSGFSANMQARLNQAQLP